MTEKLDVYSLGNVYYTLLTGRMVWEDYEYHDRTNRIIEGITLPFPDYYKDSPSSEVLARAISDCWTHDVSERPTIFELITFLEEEIQRLKKN